MTEITIRYNDNPDVGLYNDCLSVEGLFPEKDLIPAHDTLRLTVQNIKSLNTLNERAWDDLETSNHFKKSIIGEATVIDVPGEDQSLVCMKNGEVIEKLFLFFRIAKDERFGARFYYFDDRDGVDSGLNLELCLTEEHLQEIADVADSALTYAGTIEINLEGFKGFYQSWHPGLYDINNHFRFYFLPDLNSIENSEDVPEHYGHINRSTNYHKQVSISFELKKILHVPLTSDEDYALRYPDEEGKGQKQISRLEKYGGIMFNIFGYACLAYFLYWLASAFGLLEN